MDCPRIARAWRSTFLLVASLLLAGVSACVEREAPPPAETAVPEVQAAESVSTTTDSLRGDSLMARDTLPVPE